MPSRCVQFVLVTSLCLVASSAIAVGPPPRPSHVSLQDQLALIEVMDGEYKLAGKGKDRYVVEFQPSRSWESHDLRHLVVFDRLERLDLSKHPNLDDADLENVLRLRTLRSLELGPKDLLSNETCRKIAKLPRLERLLISSTGVLDEGIVQLAKLRNLRFLSCSAVKDRSLLALSRCPRLEHLEFKYGIISERGARAFASMGRLKELVMGWTKLPNDAQLHLRHLTGLRLLDVDDVPITDAGFETISALPALERLQMSIRSGTGPSEKALAKFARMKKLKSLFTSGLDDKFLKALSGCPSIEWIRFPNPSSVTDVGVAYLARCRNLRELDLGGEGITDASIPVLTNMKSLRRVYGGYTKITGEGWKCLAKSRPDIKQEIGDW